MTMFEAHGRRAASAAAAVALAVLLAACSAPIDVGGDGPPYASQRSGAAPAARPPQRPHGTSHDLLRASR